MPFPAKAGNTTSRPFPAFLKIQAALAYRSVRSVQELTLLASHAGQDGQDPGPRWPDPGSERSQNRVPGASWRLLGRLKSSRPGPLGLAYPGPKGPGCYPTLAPDHPGVIRATGLDRPKMREQQRRCCPRGQHRSGAERAPEPRGPFSGDAASPDAMLTGVPWCSVYPGYSGSGVYQGTVWVHTGTGGITATPPGVAYHASSVSPSLLQQSCNCLLLTVTQRYSRAHPSASLLAMLLAL